MNFELSDDQVLLREQVGKLLRQASTSAQVRAAEPLGFDPVLWQKLVEFGAPIMRVPESNNGAGVTLLDAVIIAEEVGSQLASVPLVESMVAARLLALLDGPAAQEWLSRVIEAGDLVTLMPCGDIGDVSVIPGGAVAEAVVWLDGDTVRLTALSPTATTATYLGSLPFGPNQLRREHSIVLASGAAPRDAYLASVEEWKLLNAALLVGAAEKAVRLAAAYSGERTAFGKPIGSFQGVAHPLADSITDIDGSRLIIWRAVWAIARGHRDAAASVSVASWFAAQMTTKAVTRAVRVFGGYGMSMEYDVQLYFRRARGWSLTAGDPARELQRAGARLWGNETSPLPDPGKIDVDFGWGETAEKLASEARGFFEREIPPEQREFAYHSEDAHDPVFFQKLAQARLLYPEWPEHLQGRGCDPTETAALQEVFNEFDWPMLVPVVTDMVGKMILAFGSEQAKQELLPALASGHAYCSLGYSEPSGGSDVFAAKTRAIRDDDGWLLNGQKMFTTQGHLADYALLLARTDLTLPKHAGLTLFVVPLRQAGYESHEVKTIGNERTNITYYTDMRIPDHYRLGEVNGGAKVMSAALNLEQGVGLYNVGPLKRVLKHAVSWARDKPVGQGMAIDQASVQARLANVYANILVADALTRRSIRAGAIGATQKWYGSMSKLFGSEAWMSCTSDLLDLTAPASLKVEPSDTGWIEIEYRRAIPSTIYGGTSEIHRSIVAESALTMPRSRT